MPKRKSHQQPIRKALYLWSLESSCQRGDREKKRNYSKNTLVWTFHMHSGGEMQVASGYLRHDNDLRKSFG